MPSSTNEKLSVQLTSAQRKEFQAIVRSQSIGASQMRRARILLLADENSAEGRRRDWEIAESVGISTRQVVRIRQQFVRQGEAVLKRKKRADAGVPQKLDGEAESHLVALSCSKPPEGRAHWTLQMLCDELGRLKVVKSVCRETVRQCLKKIESSRG
ncbi:MAG: helix-turn-helix domain-containing protein [Planctomycetota bacterium]